jgi:hypothetical protein
VAETLVITEGVGALKSKSCWEPSSVADKTDLAAMESLLGAFLAGSTEGGVAETTGNGTAIICGVSTVSAGFTILGSCLGLESIGFAVPLAKSNLCRLLIFDFTNRFWMLVNRSGSVSTFLMTVIGQSSGLVAVRDRGCGRSASRLYLNESVAGNSCMGEETPDACSEASSPVS